jgi:hypothetical protein
MDLETEFLVPVLVNPMVQVVVSVVVHLPTDLDAK